MSNLTNHEPKIQIICGPTASGKTALAIKLAGIKPASIISADSRQIYQGLDIITGKDIPKGFIKKDSNLFFKNRKVVYYSPSVIPSDLPAAVGVEGSIRLWGLDLLSPDENFNAAEFSSLSRKIILEESAQGREVFIVGGTGFYLKSLTRPETLASVRPDENLRRHLEKLSVGSLQQKLKTLDSVRFKAMNQSDVNNPRRLIRALEISLSPLSPRSPLSSQSLKFSWLGLKTSLDDLKLRIESRVRDRLAIGAVKEVEKMLELYPDQTLPIYTTLGVKPIIKFINEEIDQEKLVSLWLTDEMNYAKRQLTWFKRQPEIVWYDK